MHVSAFPTDMSMFPKEESVRKRKPYAMLPGVRPRISGSGVRHLEMYLLPEVLINWPRVGEGRGCGHQHFFRSFTSYSSMQSALRTLVLKVLESQTLICPHYKPLR